MVNGKRIRQHLGRQSEGFNLSRAKTERDKLKVQHGDLKQPVVEVSTDHSFMVFETAAQLYIKTMKEAGGKNIRQKEQQFRDHLTPFFMGSRLASIKTLQVESYKQHRREKGASPGTINAELAALKHLYSSFREWEYMTSQPFSCTMFKTDNTKLVVFNQAQETAVLEAARYDIDPYIWLFCLIGFRTAMRHSEILNLTYANTDFDKLRFFLPEAKAGARYQPFSEDVKVALLEHRKTLADPDGFVFAAEGKFGRRHDMKSQFARVVKTAGLPPKTFTPHTMRHTAITRLMEAGVPIETVRKISGHKTLAMVQRYTHISDSAVDMALAQLNTGREQTESDTTHYTQITHEAA
jgi:integrase